MGREWLPPADFRPCRAEFDSPALHHHHYTAWPGEHTALTSILDWARLRPDRVGFLGSVALYTCDGG
jgi:hypothetical protein